MASILSPNVIYFNLKQKCKKEVHKLAEINRVNHPRYSPSIISHHVKCLGMGKKLGVVGRCFEVEVLSIPQNY